MKKVKLMIDGKEYEVEISDEQAQDLTEIKKKTGYERVTQSKNYYIETDKGDYDYFRENFGIFDCEQYECANYYSDKTVAENNARADKLYRQLRRFAVEHRVEALDWNDEISTKYSIDFRCGEIILGETSIWREFAGIFYDTKETAQLAIDTFRDELIWYFTEYEDSL